MDEVDCYLLNLNLCFLILVTVLCENTRVGVQGSGGGMSYNKRHKRDFLFLYKTC